MSTEATTNRQNGYFYISIAIIGWGLSTSLVEMGLQYITPLPFLFYRFLLATIILSPIILYQKQQEIMKILKTRWIWIIGFSEALGLIFQYFGQETVSPALSALLSLIFMLFVPFLSFILLKEQIQKKHLFAILIGFLGVFTIATEGEVSRLFGGSMLGILLLLTSAFCYGIYIVATSRLTTKEMPEVDVFALFYIVLGFITVVSFILAVPDSGIITFKAEAWLWIFLLTLFSTLIAFLAYFKALKIISANTASVLLLLQTLVPFAIDMLILSRYYSFWVFLGAILILGAAVLVITIKTEKTDVKQHIKLVNPSQSIVN